MAEILTKISFILFFIAIFYIYNIGQQDKTKRSLFSIVIFLLGVFYGIIYGIFTIGFSDLNALKNIAFIAFTTGFAFSFSAIVSWWAIEKGVNIIPRLFEKIKRK